MSINLLEQVQENLLYPPLQKVNPNKVSPNINDKKTTEVHFSEVAIPAVLIGLYKYSTTDEGATEILRGDSSTNWVSKIFRDTKVEVIESIAGFVDQSQLNSFEQMDNIAYEAIKLAKENMPTPATIKDVKTFFSGQVNNILPFLEPELKMGDILNDTGIDDNTNKMLGPISSLMHSIGSVFSTPETNNDIKPEV